MAFLSTLYSETVRVFKCSDMAHEWALVKKYFIQLMLLFFFPFLQKEQQEDERKTSLCTVGNPSPGGINGQIILSDLNIMVRCRPSQVERDQQEQLWTHLHCRLWSPGVTGRPCFVTMAHSAGTRLLKNSDGHPAEHKAKKKMLVEEFGSAEKLPESFCFFCMIFLHQSRLVHTTRQQFRLSRRPRWKGSLSRRHLFWKTQQTIEPRVAENSGNPRSASTCLNKLTETEISAEPTLVSSTETSVENLKHTQNGREKNAWTFFLVKKAIAFTSSMKKDYRQQRLKASNFWWWKNKL